MILGREQGTADVVLDDPGVSRRHARVLTDAGALVVEDLGSSNGTYVNGERIRGPVEVTTGDEVQLGDTVLGVAGNRAAATTIMRRGPVPRRLAPPTSDRGNLPALAALFLGPLSILLVFLSAGGFFIALPCGIAAIALGTIGIRNVDRGRATAHRGFARIGRMTGILGTVLALVAVIVFVVVAAALHSTEGSIGGLINRIKDEVNNVHVPKAPDVNGPSAPSSSSSGSSGGSSSGGSGGTAAPGQ